MHVGRYRKRYFLEKGAGRSDPLKPPFYCPWASEGCTWPPCYNQKEHQDHIWTVHEIPGMKEREVKDERNGLRDRFEEYAKGLAVRSVRSNQKRG